MNKSKKDLTKQHTILNEYYCFNTKVTGIYTLKGSYANKTSQNKNY